MKKALPACLLLLLILCAGAKHVKAKNPEAGPGTCMNTINSDETDMNKAYMAYISTSAHSSRKRKIEKVQANAVDNIVIYQNIITGLPTYKGDNSLRQSSLNYVQLCYKTHTPYYK